MKNKKRAVVTGASRGIGKEIALLLGKNGYTVLVNYRKNKEAAEEVVALIRENGGWAKAFCADVSKRREAFSLIEAAEKELGGIDILVNNAGISQTKLFTDVSEEELEDVLASNLKSAFYTAQAAEPLMRHQGFGRIINIASVWGEEGASMEAAYSASKAGLIGLTKALAKELAPSGITVNAVSPGVIKTDMLAQYSEDELSALAEEIPLGYIAGGREVAEAVLFLSGEGASYITGQVIAVNGGFHI